MKKHLFPKLFFMFVLLGVLLLAIPAMAASQYKAVKSCKVYKSASTRSKVIATIGKGDSVSVKAVKGKWVRVAGRGKIGYVRKDAIKKISKSAGKAQSVKTAKAKVAKKSKSAKSRVSLKQIQKRLVEKRYLSSAYATGSSNAATTKAVRIFQMMNGLTVNGKLNASTKRKIMSSSAKTRQSVNSSSWSKSGVNYRLRDGGLASLIDLATGKRIRIRRVGGYNHLDVEPKTAKDTARLKKVYGGHWSWDSRAVVLISGGRYYAAAMNGMPHGKQISKTNNFDGQFCVHLKDSITHGSSKENVYHQASIDKAIRYFK